jgi:hypothetical protein
MSAGGGGDRRAGGRAQIRDHRQPGADRKMSEPDCPPDERPPTPGALVRVLKIVNKKGLHARASAKFVQTVERFGPT